MHEKAGEALGGCHLWLPGPFVTVLDAFALSGEVAVITGGSRGLGRAAAVALAEAGAALALCARSTAGLEETSRLVRDAAGVEAYVEAVDVREPASVQSFMGNVVDAVGAPSILVNNAGIERQGFVADLSQEDWSAVISTNLDSVFHFSKAFIHRRRQGDGSIINITSIGSAVGVAAEGPYCASKAGVLGLTRTLALELAREGVRVNALAPGYFDTDMPREVTADPKSRDRLLASVPLRRLPQPAEIGPPIVFLASKASAFMTGSALYFDGGYTAR